MTVDLDFEHYAVHKSWCAKSEVGGFSHHCACGLDELKAKKRALEAKVVAPPAPEVTEHRWLPSPTYSNVGTCTCGELRMESTKEQWQAHAAPGAKEPKAKG